MGDAPTLTVPAGRKAQATHAALVRETRAAIAETGRFGAEQVATRTGVSPATFYSYFPSKEQALAAALDDVLSELVERTLGEFDVPRLLEDGIRAVVERAVASCIAVFIKDARILRLAIASLPESKIIREVYRHHEHIAIEQIERFIRLGEAAGRFPEGKARTTTVALLVMLQGLNNPLLATRDVQPGVIEQIVTSITTMLAGHDRADQRTVVLP